MSNPYHNYPSDHRTANTGPIERTGRFAKGRIGRTLLLATGVLLVAGGAAKGVQAKVNHDKAAYAATQGKISPIIEQSMIGLDYQAVEYQLSHPTDVVVTQNPDGQQGTVEFMTDHSTVIMGTKDGKPNILDPVYIDYWNNQGEPETGDYGHEYVLTAPRGNHWVNESHGANQIGFGGTTGGGWGAFELGGADTTDRGYAGNSLPPPVEAATEIATHVLEFGPYEHYSQPGEPLVGDPQD
ncbi:MAG TPA: hypothetical protein VLH84_01380 [Patescibacteria group bacterium]|nr:hypothetical protein [Patescibacteria group bacterium]